MCDLKICRICLRTEAKLYKFDRFQLLYYYEEVMALKVNEYDGLPQYFCYECATLLHKFHKFKEKCYSGQKALKEMLWKGPITYESIYKIDRNTLNLQSAYCFLKVTAHSLNIKTYSTCDDTEDAKDIKEEESMGFEVEPGYNSSFSDCGDNHDMSMDEGNQIEEKLLLISNNDTNIIKIEEPLRPTSLSEDTNHFLEKPTLLPGNDSKMVLRKRKPIRPTAVFVDESVESNENLMQVDDSEIELVELKSKKSHPPKPTTVFVDDEKNIVIMKDKPILETNDTTVAITRNAKKCNFVSRKKKTRFLDARHWKKFNLSEEEAVTNFRSRAEDQKYLAAAYKCTDCLKGFSKEEMLKRHKHLRHNESIGEHECRFCRMRFRWDCILRKHMRQHFTKYQCLRCDLICPIENTALLHDEYHNGIIRKCIHCNEEFRHMSTYYTHMRTHRSEHICALCGVSFVSEAGLRQHKIRKHIDDEIESPDDDEEVNTFCEKCDIRFETRKAYNEHLFHSAMHMEGVDYTLIDEYSLPKKILGKKAQKQITIKLNKNKDEDDLKLPPIKTHRKKKKQRRVPKKPMDCHQCGKHFETQAACLKHHLAEHPRTSFFSPTDRHICEICGASLAPGSVAMHQNIHSREKVFNCETCSRSFHSSIGLKRHMVTHTGEKPFGCTLCDKKFTQSNSMKLHYRTFHLKQPYPKRNRRKKKDDPPMVTEDESKTGEESNDSERQRQGMPAQEQVHYLTLN